MSPRASLRTLAHQNRIAETELAESHWPSESLLRARINLDRLADRSCPRCLEREP